MADFLGRRAVVTGGASGIGRAIARALAEQGASLEVCDLDEEALEQVALDLRAKGAKVRTHRVDVSDDQAVAAFADTVAAEGPVHVVINNAGVGVGGMIADTPTAAWRRVVDVNLLGVAHGCHAFIPHLRSADGQRALINIASASAFGGVPGLGAYAATKAAVLSLSETLHTELAADGIQVHCVCPGFVRTGLLKTTTMYMDDAASTRDRIWEKLFRPDRTPDGVATATLRAVRRNRFLVPVFSEGHAGAIIRNLPDGVRAAVRREVHRRMQGMASGSK